MKEPFSLYKRCEKDGTKHRCATYPRCACDWYDRPRDPDGKRRWVHLPRTANSKPFAYTQALKFRHDRQEIASGLKAAPKPPAPPLASVLAAYKKTNDVTSQKESVRTIKNLDDFLAFVKDRPLDQVTGPVIDQWRAELLTRPSKKTGGTWSRNTAQRRYNSVKGFFEWATTTHPDVVALAIPNPCATLDDMSQDPAPRRLWQPNEQWLIDQLPPVYRWPLTIGHLCGCRRTEALTLTKHDLSPKGWSFKGTSTVKLGWLAIQRQKKRIGLVKERIPIAARLVEDLRKLVTTPFQVHIFGDPPPEPNAWSSLLTRHLRKLGDEYGIDTRGLCMHGTRHTATTTMTDLPGVSTKTAQNMGGWTSTRMVEKYSSPGEASMQVAAAGLAQAFKPRKPRGLTRVAGRTL